MEYLYAAMLLHKAGKQITEDAITNIIKAAGIEPDEAKVKALVSALKDVNIDEAISNAVAQQSALTQQKPQQTEQEKAKEKESPKKEEKPKTEEAAAGLGALFG